MRRISAVLVVAAGVSSTAGAQSIAQRVAASDGTVEVVFPSRAAACGDGETFIGNVLGPSTYYSGSSTFSGQGSWSSRPCIHGPARVVATVANGEITRIRLYVGPVPPARPDVRALSASADEAAAWLTEVVLRAPSRPANEAMLPLVVADGREPWPLLLRAARDDTRPRAVRRAAVAWLGRGVIEHLGLSDSPDATDDDEMRTQAVFVLSQRPRSESVPELIDLARTAKNPAVRRAAIFWLGQADDARAINVYAELLHIQ